MPRFLLTILIVLALALPVKAGLFTQNDDGLLSLQFGLGIGHGKGKMLTLSYADSLPEVFRLPKIFVYEIGAGVYNQNNFFNSKYTGVGQIMVGLDVETELGIYARALSGVAGITREDELVSGHFQFPIKVGIGFGNKYGRVGGFYQHLSNGGLKDPNTGRDWLGLEMGVRF